MKAIFAGLGAIALWSSLAAVAVRLADVPPFFLTGVALCIGGSLALPKIKHWRMSVPVVMTGVYGLFVYHFLLFMALRYAPALQANLLNYLWPLLIVLMTPWFFKHQRLLWSHYLAVCLGLSGAAIAILSGQSLQYVQWHWGYALAIAAALVWSSYSLLIKRQNDVSVWTNGAICLISGVLALCCHLLFETAPSLTQVQWGLVALLGIGPMGAAFYLWDIAMKQGDARVIGTLAYATPVLSTWLLAVSTGQPVTWSLLMAVGLVVMAGLICFIVSKRPNR